MEREMKYYRDKLLEKFKKHREYNEKQLKIIREHLYNRMDQKIYRPLQDEIDFLRDQVNELINGPKLGLLDPVWHLELSVRAMNCMQNAKIETVGELVKKSNRDLLRIKNLGRGTLKEIKKELFLKYGLRLKGEEEI
jgi:DNA-directed RNA polymerase alpha subunit